MAERSNFAFLEEHDPIFLQLASTAEQAFAFADQLEAKVASAKSRIDHLSQSILAKAFRGELVPQDPNDEPVCVLLDASKPNAPPPQKPSAADNRPSARNR